ncbi:MAG: deoxyribonuclease IV [Chlamydiia bacterium]|nr:deoxyribonuclease IV [Chlamydiia bacterium]MCP5509188.1 deoxyribonuclease IV [Chlamydiales bacterium]HPE84630.1 deoxyribonuclease IV [Chlamydiales bacterium]
MQEILVGAHFSAAGGVHNAVIRAAEMEATTLQLFTSNQKQWSSRPIEPEIVEKFLALVEETGMQKIMSHDSYLINLGSPKQDLLEKSIAAFKGEIERCTQLKLSYMNFHPGAATGSEEEECLDTIARSILKCQSLATKDDAPLLLLESTAGQGTALGWRFEHLAHIIEKVAPKMPIGVCIDTCHVFAAGYDIRDKKAWDHTLKEFDDVVGLKYLKALHVNDSLKPLGSRRDRHANLGEGEIGIESFEAMMRHPKLQKLPKYLETPNGDTCWKKEIQLLKDFAKK